MSDDLAFLRARIPEYKEYTEEAAVHDSDMRVRAYVGEALSAGQARLAASLDGEILTALEATLLRCMFTDQAFVRKFEHADIAPAVLVALVKNDRSLVELADRVATVTLGDFTALIRQIDELFDLRRTPVAATA